MASFVEQVASLRKRIASRNRAARDTAAAPPDPPQRESALQRHAAEALAEVMAAGKDRAEDPHPTLAAGRSLAALTLERQGAPLALVPPPELAELMVARTHQVVVPDPEVAAARSLAEQRQAAREQLEALKKQSCDELRQVRSIKSRKEQEHRCTTESISRTTAMIEKLKRSLMELRDKRAYAGLSEQFHQDLEIREAKTNEDAALLGNFEALFSWLHKFLGLQVVIGEEGLKFVFDKIHLQCPEKEYLLWLKIDDRTYNLVQCDPPIEDIEELVKDLNLSGDVLKFLKVARERFQASSTNDVPSLPPPVTTTVDRASEDVPNQSNSGSKNKSLPAKRRAMILSSGSVRRSPRLQVCHQQED